MLAEDMCFGCLSVSLSVSSIAQKRLDGFGSNFARRHHLGHGRTE